MEVLRHIMFVTVLILSFQAFAQDSNTLMPMNDEPSDSSATGDFKVTTKKIINAKTIDVAKAITALKPPAKATFTPGTIEFAWKVNSNLASKKSIIILENLETGETSTHPTGDKNLSLDLTPGKYRWQVTLNDSQAQTFWRYLTVVGDASRVADGNLKSIPSLNIEIQQPLMKPKLPMRK